jgi:hypothetical protein
LPTPWIQASAKIKLLPNGDKRQPYPLSWNEQTRLFRELPDHLAEMALFAVNTGCRDAEICNLRWEWEVEVPELGPPPMKWSDSKYGFATEEDCNGEEAQA